MHELSRFQRDLLYVIAGLDRPSGLEIADELADYYADDVSSAMVYDNLDSLVENGLVEKRYRTGRTKAYTLTERGEAALVARREWEDERLDRVADCRSGTR